MALPDPQPGLVIRYSYLWRSESENGRDEGTKDRPCAVVLAVKSQAGSTVVVVAPITHSLPTNTKTAIEIPQETKIRLGLDHARSWVITDDLNYFTWPGPDIRPIRYDAKGKQFAYGFLPARITRTVIESVRDLMRSGKAKPVNRNTPPHDQR